MKQNGKFLLIYLFFSFILFGMWEWIQTPFFIDITDNINLIVWYRIHCTIGDTLILGSSIGIYSFLIKNFLWVYNPRKKDYIWVTVLGVGYTGFSEILNVVLNVVIRQSWSYSKWMPVIPGTYIGIVPILQWLILPSLILYICKRFKNNS